MKKTNPYIQNLNRIEFLITLACTGQCKHCSEGEHIKSGQHIDGDAGAEAVYKLCGEFDIGSLMTFGGEPLLYSEEVCKIHAAGRKMQIPKRQIITNGFFRTDQGQIEEIVVKLAESGVNEILLSADAFHQETIPLETVKIFAEAVKTAGIPLQVHPAWLVGRESSNQYDRGTGEILEEFRQMGIEASEGNIIFPSGNALKYLGEYFKTEQNCANPYEEDPKDIRSICIAPDGTVLNGNIYEQDILDILENYKG